MSGQRIADGQQCSEPALPSWIHELPPASREERVEWAWKIVRLAMAARAFFDHADREGWTPMLKGQYGEDLRAALAAVEDTGITGEKP